MEARHRGGAWPSPAASDPSCCRRLKRVTSRWFYRLLSAIGDVDIEPGSADFLLLDREAVDPINGFDDRDVFLRGLVRWFGLPLATSRYAQGTRSAGESSYTLGRMIDLRSSASSRTASGPCASPSICALLFTVVGLSAVRSILRQLPMDPSHGRRLDLDHVGDRHSRRRAIPGARHHRRISRPLAAREPPLADLSDRGTEVRRMRTFTADAPNRASGDLPHSAPRRGGHECRRASRQRRSRQTRSADRQRPSAGSTTHGTLRDPDLLFVVAWTAFQIVAFFVDRPASDLSRNLRLGPRIRPPAITSTRRSAR